MSMDHIPQNIDTGAKSGRSGPNATLIALLVVAALGVIFFFQNGELTSIDFLVFEKKTTIRWSILMAFIVGVVCDRLFSVWWKRKGRRSDKPSK